MQKYVPSEVSDVLLHLKEENNINNGLPINITMKYSSVILNNEIHIFGNTDHYKLDSLLGIWVKVSTLPYKFSGSCAVVLNNEIHILGGYYATTSHYKYNSSTNTWSSVSTLPRTFQGNAAVISNGAINIFIGTHRYSYKPSEGYWVEQVSNPLSVYTAVVSDGWDIYMLNSSNIYYFRYNGSDWYDYGSLPFDFSYGDAVITFGDYTYIDILGGNSSTSTFHYKRIANSSSASWSEISTLPISFYCDAISLGSYIYLMQDKKFYKYNGSWTNVYGDITDNVVLPYTRYDNVFNRPRVVYDTSSMNNGAPFNLLALQEEEMTEAEINDLYNKVRM